MENSYEFFLDRIRGLFAAFFLGDVLGSPHEFRCNRKLIYSGKVEHEAFLVTRFQGKKTLSVGQVTDDSEMTLALLRYLAEHNFEYRGEEVLKAYLDWANSGGWMLGKNTRALLKGVKTVKGYEKRMAKILELPEDERSQSNGAMMRCTPLALLPYDEYPPKEGAPARGYLIAVETDANLTNPHPIVVWCNRVYLYCLRRCLRGDLGPEIFSDLKHFLRARQSRIPEEVSDVYFSIRNRRSKKVGAGGFREAGPVADRNLTHQKGWCLHGLWCALRVLILPLDYPARIEELMVPGADTDTIAAIAGAMVGAMIGFETLSADPTTAENFEIVLGCDTSTAGAPTPRPKKYSPHDFYSLTKKVAKMTC